MVFCCEVGTTNTIRRSAGIVCSALGDVASTGCTHESHVLSDGQRNSCGLVRVNLLQKAGTDCLADGCLMVQSLALLNPLLHYVYCGAPLVRTVCGGEVLDVVRVTHSLPQIKAVVDISMKEQPQYMP